MLHGFPRTLQALIPDTYKAQLPWVLALPGVLPTNSLYCLHQLESTKRTSTETGPFYR